MQLDKDVYGSMVSSGSDMSVHQRQRRDRLAQEHAAGKTARGTSGRRRWVALIVLVAYSLLLIYRALLDREAWGVPVWGLQDSDRLLRWVGGLAVTGLCEFAYFIPVGFMAAFVVRRGSGLLGRLASSLRALIAAVVLTALVCAVEIGRSWHLAAAMGMTLPLLGCLFGVWAGAAWLRGRRARLWFLPKVALLGMLACIFTGVFLRLSIEERPLAFEAARVTSADKRRLVHLIRRKSPRSLDENRTHTLRLTDQDINVLLSWGLSLGSPQRKAKVELTRDNASLSWSIGVMLGGGKMRYVNLEVDVNCGIDGQIVKLDLHRCRLGSVQAPRRVLDFASKVITSILRHNRLTKPFMDAIRGVKIEPGSIEATYGRVDMPPGFREDLFGPAGASEEVLASTRAQVENLLALAGRLAPERPGFGKCFETAFVLARDRSVESDPIVENRAAIFALGMLLGHPRVEDFLGPVLSGRGRGSARWALRRIKLRGRYDWTKHFCVSAAIAAFSDELVSDAAGLLKEELDAEVGRSGFSFADLLADRAGTTFAAQATVDQASARAMQDRLAGGFAVDDFFPSAADLPQGIADPELQSRYGGVGGQGYRRLMDEIEQRIAGCAAYR